MSLTIENLPRRNREEQIFLYKKLAEMIDSQINLYEKQIDALRKTKSRYEINVVALEFTAKKIRRKQTKRHEK